MKNETEVVICNIRSINKSEVDKALKCHPIICEENAISYKREIDQIRHSIGILLMISMCPYTSPVFTIKRDTCGKPYVVEFSDYNFNISHSGDYVVCATSQSKVGVDIQVSEYLSPASWELFMTTNEIEMCRGLDMSCMIWSAKEAITKCIGCGLSPVINEIDLSDIYNAYDDSAEKNISSIISFKGKNLYLFQKNIIQDHYLSLCNESCCIPKINKVVFDSGMFIK